MRGKSAMASYAIRRECRCTAARTNAGEIGDGVVLRLRDPLASMRPRTNAGEIAHVPGRLGVVHAASMRPPHECGGNRLVVGVSAECSVWLQ